MQVCRLLRGNQVDCFVLEDGVSRMVAACGLAFAVLSQIFGDSFRVSRLGIRVAYSISSDCVIEFFCDALGIAFSYGDSKQMLCIAIDDSVDFPKFTIGEHCYSFV